MARVLEPITLISDNEEEEEEEDDDDDSDVEFIAVVSRGAEPLPVGVVQVGARGDDPQHCSDITASESIHPELKIPLRPDFAAIPIIDLTNICTEIKEADFETQKVCSPTDEQMNTQQRSTSANLSTRLKQTQDFANPQTQILTDVSLSPYVKLVRLPFIEDHITEIKQLSCFVYTIKGRTHMSLQPRQQDATSEAALQDLLIKMEDCNEAAKTPACLSSSKPTHEHAGTGRYSERQWEYKPIEDKSDATPVGDMKDLVSCQRGPEDLSMDDGEERDFVWSVALDKLMSGHDEALLMDISLHVNRKDLIPPKELCPQSLTLVNSTKEENHIEGTLQLLSDMLQPGYYPPRNIIVHVLHDILLEPNCPNHLCVQAFQLLIRTQRHHPVDINTVPWDWNLLTSVMTDEEHPKKWKGEVVWMFLEYVVRTLEDDLYANDKTYSICRAMLSCQFYNIRDLLKWLFSAIMKSINCDKDKEAKERDEHIKLVSIFQRMLSLVLAVDIHPTVLSDKLSQELLHMLIMNSFRRPHRMLLLESLRSKLLQCKLLEHMLNYTCSAKSQLPMSLSLLLHFMRNCVPLEDHTDGPDQWRNWEELIHLLWMFRHSYSKAKKVCLRQMFNEESSRLGPFKMDVISKSDVFDATEALLKRAQADLGQALPHHVEESLHFLRDNLLDTCQG